MMMLLLVLCAVMFAGLLCWPVRTHFSSPRQWLVRCFLPVCVVSVALGAGLYTLYGAAPIIEKLEERQKMMEKAAQDIRQLSQTVADSPQQPEAWARLGIAFLEAEQYSEAVRSLKQAVVLSGGQPAYILTLVKAQVFEANGQVTPEAKQGLSLLKTLLPDNDERIYFEGLLLMQEGKKDEAAALFREIAGRKDTLPALLMLANKHLAELSAQ